MNNINEGIMEENLMSGTEALKALGITYKKGKSVDLLKPYGIAPIFAKKTSNGTTVFVKREDVLAAVKKLESEREEDSLEKNRDRDVLYYVAKKSDDASEVLRRVEAKMDRLLALWGG